MLQVIKFAEKADMKTNCVEWLWLLYWWWWWRTAMYNPLLSTDQLVLFIQTSVIIILQLVDYLGW